MGTLSFIIRVLSLVIRVLIVAVITNTIMKHVTPDYWWLWVIVNVGIFWIVAFIQALLCVVFSIVYSVFK